MSFSDIKGQDKAIAVLKAYLERGRAVSSFLFTGPEGVGKFLTAKTLAKALLCSDSHGDSCDHCVSCRKIEGSKHPDVHLLLPPAGAEKDGFAEGDDAGMIKIEAVRSLQKEMSLCPYEAARKVFIINDAHRLTPEASNALLKTLEEPSPDSIIILVSAHASRLFKTVLSRCRVVRFAALHRRQLEEFVHSRAALDRQSAHFLAYFCEGRIGRAMELSAGDILRTKNDVIDEIVGTGQVRSNERATYSRQQLKIRLAVVATWLRDLYLHKAGLPEEELIHIDRARQIAQCASAITVTSLDELARCVLNALVYVDQNVNPKLIVSNVRWTFQQHWERIDSHAS